MALVLPQTRNMTRNLTTDTALAEAAVDQARRWLTAAAGGGTRHERATSRQLEEIVTDDAAVRFVMDFVDRVVRPDSDRVAADQLKSVVTGAELPGFLSPVDKVLLRLGARVAPLAPRVVMPLARARMRSIVGHLVAPAEPERLADHLSGQQTAGFALNVNLLGEAVLGEGEAQRRLDELLELLDQPAVDYVSVKISAVASQLNHFAHADSLQRVRNRLTILFTKAATVQPATFINLDMEEYHDLELTLAAFMDVLGKPEFKRLDAGIVLQAYLPDSFDALQVLTSWANERKAGGGGEIKVRLVKGANLAMERVDAAMHGWEQAPYGSKVEADANYKRCIDWLVDPDRTQGISLGLASHNLFDIAWTRLLSLERGVGDRVQYEMLQGMAPAEAAVIASEVQDDGRLLMYTPAVRSENFDVAISYLFRRLEENAADENFMRHIFKLADDPAVFEHQAKIFLESMALRDTVSGAPQRTQNRSAPPQSAYAVGDPFLNEPDTDPVLSANRAWIDEVISLEPMPASTPVFTRVEQIEGVVEIAQLAAAKAVAQLPAERQLMLHRVGDELALRRGEFISTMMHEANKTFAEADGEVSEAIDFARWYGDQAVDLVADSSLVFEPLGTVAVVPPWNFPVAIPAGGVLASLAAGNAVIFKPAPETPRCAELVAEACWAAGVDPSVLQFVRTPDDHVGRHLIESVDAVILTGSTETADLFRSWVPDLKLFAETSGKNVLIVSPNADIDLAVADLVHSAFSHGGQKCSAASLAILVGEAYESERFRRQLADAVQSLNIGDATAIETDMARLISEPNPRLERGLLELDEGEEWLVQPRRLDEGLWTPGIRLGVRPGSWFHTTECFGPVLGLMRAENLDQAIEIQNSSAFGLTGGIHSLDPEEIQRWVDRVEVGNAYINRAITGAIVQRQPFGGWKRSSIGPGAKAGGPNYIAQLGTWQANDPQAVAVDDFDEVWASHFAIDHDPTGLFCEANIFRYVPLDKIVLRVEAGAPAGQVELARKAARVAGVALIESHADQESQAELAGRLCEIESIRIRFVGGSTGPALVEAANQCNVHLASAQVVAAGKIELQHYVREQAISETLHRFGNLTTARQPSRIGRL